MNCLLVCKHRAITKNTKRMRCRLTDLQTSCSAVVEEVLFMGSEEAHIVDVGRNNVDISIMQTGQNYIEMEYHITLSYLVRITIHVRKRYTL